MGVLRFLCRRGRSGGMYVGQWLCVGEDDESCVRGRGVCLCVYVVGRMMRAVKKKIIERLPVYTQWY